MTFDRLTNYLLSSTDEERNQIVRRLSERKGTLKARGVYAQQAAHRKLGATASKPSTLLASAALGFGLASSRGRGRGAFATKALTLFSVGSRVFTLQQQMNDDS